MAYRLDDAQALEELRLLWSREMTGNCYQPRLMHFQREDGATASGLTFVANSEHQQHASAASPATVAGVVSVASGVFGPNIDYLTQLDAAMCSRGLHDPYIDAIVDLLRA